MYNIPKGTSATPGNELAIFESIADVYAQEDLDLFFATFSRYVSVFSKPSRFETDHH
jgi:tripeptidyl-peptidase-1